MDRLVETLHRYSRYGAWFGGGLIVATALIVSADVLMRKLLNITLGGADELSGFALAISSAWAFGYALFERAHVRIDSVYVWLPFKVRGVLDLVGLIVFLLFMGLLAYKAIGVFVSSVELGSRTMTDMSLPLAYPEFVWVIGLWFFVLIAGAMLIRALGAAFRGDWMALHAQLGSKTVSEEVHEELADAERRAASLKNSSGDAAGGGAA